MEVVYTVLAEDEQVAKDNVDKHPEIEDKLKDNPPNENKVDTVVSIECMDNDVLTV